MSGHLYGINVEFDTNSLRKVTKVISRTKIPIAVQHLEISLAMTL